MSNGKLRNGQDYIPLFSFLAPYIQQMRDDPGAAALLGTDAVDIAPRDQDASLTKIYNLAAIQETLTNYKLLLPGRTNIAFPAVLGSISVVTEQQHADGGNNATGGGVKTGSGAYRVQTQVAGDGQASGALMQDIVFDLQHPDGTNKKAVHFVCFMAVPDNGTISEADLLTKIKSLNSPAWNGMFNSYPNWNPQSHVVVVTGRAASVRVSADVSSFKDSDAPGTNTVSTSSSNVSDYHSYQVSVKSIIIPESVHGTLTIGSAPSPTTITASAEAQITSTFLPNVTAGPITKTETISGQLSPTSLSATTGLTGIPTSGIFLLDVDVQPFDYNLVKIVGTVVDFSNL